MSLKAERAIPGVLLAFLIVRQEAASRQPADADLQAAYGWALVQAGDVSQGPALFQTALEFEPDSLHALYYLGLIYPLQRQADLVVEALMRLVKHPDPQGGDELARRVLASMGYQPS